MAQKQIKTIQFPNNDDIYEIVDEKARNRVEANGGSSPTKNLEKIRVGDITYQIPAVSGSIITLPGALAGTYGREFYDYVSNENNVPWGQLFTVYFEGRQMDDPSMPYATGDAYGFFDVDTENVITISIEGVICLYIDPSTNKCVSKFVPTPQVSQASETTLGGIKASAKLSTDTQEVRIDTNTGKLYTKPGGEGSYTLPQASWNKLGGVKASAKLPTDTQEVRIDTNTGKLYTLPASGGGSGSKIITFTGKIINIDLTNALKSGYSVSTSQSFSESELRQLADLIRANYQNGPSIKVPVNFTLNDKTSFQCILIFYYSGEGTLEYGFGTSQQICYDYDTVMRINNIGQLEVHGTFAIDADSNRSQWTYHYIYATVNGRPVPKATASDFGGVKVISRSPNDDYTESVKMGDDGRLYVKPGHPGQNGKDGITPHIGPNGNWFIGSKDTNTSAQGPVGPDGAPGQPGQPGANGADGSDGITPHIGTNNNWFIGDQDTNITAQGVPGADGHTPVIGIGDSGNWIIDGVDSGVKAQGPKGDPGEPKKITIENEILILS